MKNFLGKLQIKGDKIIWIVYFALSIFSLIFVFTSIGKNVYRLDGNILTTFFKQLFIIAVGIIAIFIVHNIKYVRYAKFLKILYAFSVGLLLFTLIAGKIFGKVANRWIEIPGIGQFQPSEFVKYILIKDNYLIFIDASTTTLQMTEFLNANSHLIVVTNSILVSSILTKKGIKNFLAGGEMQQNSMCYAGIFAENFIRQFNFNLAFFSSHGVDENNNIDLAEAEKIIAITIDIGPKSKAIHI